jgi:hypothetical protein
MGRLFQSVIVHDWPPWVFDLTNIGFGVLVLVTFVFARPRWPRFSRRAVSTVQSGSVNPA